MKEYTCSKCHKEIIAEESAKTDKFKGREDIFNESFIDEFSHYNTDEIQVLREKALLKSPQKKAAD